MFDTDNLDLEDMQIKVQAILNDLEDLYDQYNLRKKQLYSLIVQGNDLEYKDKEYWHKTVYIAIDKVKQRFNNCLNELDYLHQLNNECIINIEN